MTQPTPVPPDPHGTPALPRDLLLFLIQLSVSLNKSRSSLSSHPVLKAGLVLDPVDAATVEVAAGQPAGG